MVNDHVYKDYAEFFRTAKGKDNGEACDPFPYQNRLATEPDFPQLLNVPTGLGKTAAAVLAWIWRRRYAEDSVRFQTPRRLVYCLPMRVLVEQTTTEAVAWLRNLDLLGDTESGKGLDQKAADDWRHRIPVVVLMGGEDEPKWDRYPERDMIIIGTQDMLLSRALNRGYGMSRYRWPMQFGLLNNDCLWIFDEVQLMGPGTATSAQMQAFREKVGVMKDVHSLWMSATTDPAWLKTVDFDPSVQASKNLGLNELDVVNPVVSTRLNAQKTVKKAPIDALDPKAVADLVLTERKTDTLTIVVTNTVKRARAIFDAIQKKSKKGSVETILLHSQFRPGDRRAAIDRLLHSEAKDRICVSTQVIEAGVDVSAHDMFLDVAPWTSIVQRIGRCNRYGEHSDSNIHWLDTFVEGKKESCLPYDVDLVVKGRSTLIEMEGGSLSPARLPLVSLERPEEMSIRKKDLFELFDTTTDLTGKDADISRFIRDSDERNVSVFWRDITERPERDVLGPQVAELCPAPIGEVKKFLESKTGYRFDQLDGEWNTVGQRNVSPGMIVMFDRKAGGYDNNIGWAVDSKVPVEVVPFIKTDLLDNDLTYDSQTSNEEWKTIEEHTQEVMEAVSNISTSLDLLEGHVTILREAAKWHDAGKAHQQFQNRILTGTGRSKDEKGPWGKAPKECWIRGRNGLRRHFRHELASGLLARANGCPDIVCYLAAAHHGKIRMSLRSLPDEIVPQDRSRRFARGVWDGDVIQGFRLDNITFVDPWTVDLDCMELGTGTKGKSWLEMSLGLRDDIAMGPFRLAYMEALIKAADERASGGMQ